MNKLVIPVVLVALIAIAAGFAFSPADEAATVHIDIKDHICVVDEGTSDTGFSSDPEDNGCLPPDE